MSDSLEERAEAWVREIHPHAPHLIAARDWVVRLDPEARPELRVAAVLHDIERAFPSDAGWDPAQAWDDPAYLRWHQDRSAEIASRWLEEQEAPQEVVGVVDDLIRVHEDGGWDEADVLQAADSLSFFQTVTGVTIDWVRKGADPSRARAKLQYMADRIRFEPAQEQAEILLGQSMAELDAAIDDHARR